MFYKKSHKTIEYIQKIFYLLTGHLYYSILWERRIGLKLIYSPGAKQRTPTWTIKPFHCTAVKWTLALNVERLFLKQPAYQFNCYKTRLKKTFLDHFLHSHHQVLNGIIKSHQQDREQKTFTLQQSSPVKKIVRRTEWEALGRLKSIKPGIRWVFGRELSAVLSW